MFLPNPKLYFGSFAAYAIALVLLWFFVLVGMGPSLSLGGIFGFGFPPELLGEPDEAATAVFASAQSAANEFWFYQFFVIADGGNGR